MQCRSIWYFLVTIAIMQVHTCCGDGKKFHPLLTMEIFYKVQVLQQNTLYMIFWGMEILGCTMHDVYSCTLKENFSAITSKTDFIKE